MARKIDVVKRELKLFVDDIHIDGKHAGAIALSGNSVEMYEFSTQSEKIKYVIDDLSARGQISLYDSIDLSVKHMSNFQSSQNMMTAPSVIITFTDGPDNASSRSIDDVQNTIDKTGFYPENGCFNFIIPYGQANVHRDVLNTLCGDKYGAVIDSDSGVHEFSSVIKKLLVQAAENGVERGIIETSRNKVEGRRIRKKVDYARVVPLSYILNLNLSGSMSDVA